MSIVTLVSALLGGREALAYCRSTTCEPSVETCTVDGNDCPRSGAPLSWRSLPLTYRFSAGGTTKLDMDQAREAIRRAFETWSNVTCNGTRTSLTFQEGSDIRASGPLTGKNPAKTSLGIYFRDSDWPYDDGEESLALTNQTYGDINGYIDYSDIEVNMTSRAYRLTDQEAGIDLQAVMTHEVGQYIGLAHSRVESSIMVASYRESSDRCGASTDAARALAEDDKAAVCALYPPGGIAGVAYDDGSSSSCAVAAAGAGGAGPTGRLRGDGLVALGPLAVAAGVARKASGSLGGVTRMRERGCANADARTRMRIRTSDADADADADSGCGTRDA